MGILRQIKREKLITVTYLKRTDARNRF